MTPYDLDTPTLAPAAELLSAIVAIIAAACLGVLFAGAAVLLLLLSLCQSIPSMPSILLAARRARALRRAPLGPALADWIDTGHPATTILRYTDHTILRTHVTITWAPRSAALILQAPDGARALCRPRDLLEIHRPGDMP